MIEILIDGPGKNALGTELILSITERLRAAAGAPVLLKGAGTAFSAGLDLKEVAGLDEASMGGFLERLERLICGLYQYPGPVVACVNGHAIAGGCVLALCADRRVLASDPRLRMGLNEAALGLRFPPLTLEVVRRRVPMQHHEEVLLGANLFAPLDAARVGLVDLVADDPASVAEAELAKLAAIPADAYADLKRSLRGGSPVALCDEESWRQRVSEMLPVWSSEALKEKLRAVLKK